MNIYQSFGIVLVLSAIGYFGFAYASKNVEIKTASEDLPTTAKFQGKIKQVNTDCWTTGPCSVVLESNAVITTEINRGDVLQRDSDEPKIVWGVLIGFKLDQKYIGRNVEVFAKDTGSFRNSDTHYYTLEGSRDYYIKMLPE